MTIVKSADCTETITAMTKMVTACVIVALVRLIHMREVKKMTDDTISRAAAIDAVNNMIRRKFGISADLGTGALLELPSATDTNVGGNLIDRQAAIEAMRRAKDKSELHRMLVQLPSAQPDVPDTYVGDMISRQAAIDDIRTMNPKDAQLDIKWVEMWLKQLPPVTQKQPGWIPVTERLPKPNEYENDVRAYYLVQNEYGDMMVCSWDGRCWMQMYRHTHVEDKVVAWMPLPKPWKGE